MLQCFKIWQQKDEDKKSSLNLPAFNLMNVHTSIITNTNDILPELTYLCARIEVFFILIFFGQSEWATRTKRGFIGTHSSFGSHSCNASLVSSGVEVFWQRQQRLAHRETLKHYHSSSESWIRQQCVLDSEWVKAVNMADKISIDWW